MNINESELFEVKESLKKIGRFTYQTIVRKLSEITLTGNLEIAREEYSGILSELLLVSTSGVSGNDDYSVRVVADGNEVYNETFSNFSAYYHSYCEDVSANDDGSYIYLNIRDVFFTKSLKIEVYKIGSQVTFDRIIVKLYKKVA